MSSFADLKTSAQRVAHEAETDVVEKLAKIVAKLCDACEKQDDAIRRLKAEVRRK